MYLFKIIYVWKCVFAFVFFLTTQHCLMIHCSYKGCENKYSYTLCAKGIQSIHSNIARGRSHRRCFSILMCYLYIVFLCKCSCWTCVTVYVSHFTLFGAPCKGEFQLCTQYHSSVTTFTWTSVIELLALI